MTQNGLRDRFEQLSGRANGIASRLKQLRLSPLNGIVLVGLLATTVGSALFALYAALGPVGGGADDKAPQWSPPRLSIAELDPPKPASADSESSARPIFTKGRRPTPKTSAKSQTPDTAGDAVAAPSNMAVNAIVASRKNRQAYLVSADTPIGAWRKIGDTVDSWTIAAIAATEVILKSGGQALRLKLYNEPATSSGPVDAPAPTSPFPPPPPPVPGLKSP